MTLLVEKIRSRKASIAVVGLGHVGLPIATVLADLGFKVMGVDVKKEVVEFVSSGKNYVKEPMLNELVRSAVEKGRLKATTDTVKAVKNCDVVIISVQTPLTEDKKPNLKFLADTCRSVAKGLLKDKLVILMSTVPPGTTRNLVARMLEASGFECGRDFYLAYCPERIAPGKAVRELAESPRVVGGFNSESADVAAELFKVVTKGDVMITDCETAELAKLAENTFRDVSIAFANELALICERLGVDVVEAIRLANTHPRVNIHNPGCGVGGPCLPKDPHLLLSSVEGGDGYKSHVISSARELNDFMPRHTVDLVVKALKKVGKKVKGAKIAVLGVAYKGEVEDTRGSPAETITRELLRLGATVVVYDPYSHKSFGAERAGDVEETVKGSDCIVIATDHKVFKELDLKRMRSLMNSKAAIVDGKRVIDPEEAKKHSFKYLGVGI